MSPPRKVRRYSPSRCTCISGHDLAADNNDHRLSDTDDDDDNEWACPIHPQISPLTDLEVYVDEISPRRQQPTDQCE